MNDKQVSLIIPVRNPVISDLEKCLESVRKQTYPNIECIIIFDKSTEESDNKVLSAIESIRLHNVKIVKRSISDGFTNALNEGIRRSSGDYIARLDSDDVCTPERIRLQKEYIERNACSLVGSWTRIIDEDDRVIRLFCPPIDSIEIRRQIMKHNPIMHSSIMCVKKDIEQVGYYDASFDGSEDYELYLRMIGRGYIIKNIPEFLVDIRERWGSILRSKRWKNNRRMYSKAKYKAAKDYGFRHFPDLFYAAISPLSYFITPSKALKIKSVTGWYKLPNDIHPSNVKEY